MQRRKRGGHPGPNPRHTGAQSEAKNKENFMSDFVAKHVKDTFVQIFHAPPEKVFPLLCHMASVTLR
jgi:hypothetical protein